MLKTTPIGPLVCEASLAPAEVLLEAGQLRYSTRLLSLPKSHPAKEILPVSFREGDQHAQLGEQIPGTDNGLRETTEAHGPWNNTSLDN